MSTRAAIHHLTHYKYDRPVSVGPQIIRLRPAPHSRTRVISHSLKVSPANHFVNHQQDPYGNWLARYVFPDLVNELKIEVDVVADMTVYNPFDFFVEESAETWPFEYPDDLRPDLVIYRTPEHAGPRLQAFLSAIDRTPRRTIDFAIDLNRRLAVRVAEAGGGRCRRGRRPRRDGPRFPRSPRLGRGLPARRRLDRTRSDLGPVNRREPHSAGRDAALSERRADFGRGELRQRR